MMRLLSGLRCPHQWKYWKVSGLPFELILCEDASTDGSRETAVALAAADDRIRSTTAMYGGEKAVPFPMRLRSPTEIFSVFTM